MEVSALPTANRTCHSLRAEYVSVSTAAFACVNQAVSVFNATGGDVTAGRRNTNQTTRVFKKLRKLPRVVYPAAMLTKTSDR